jgi:hypothetical protein
LGWPLRHSSIHLDSRFQFSIFPSTTCNPTLGSEIRDHLVPPCVLFYSYCHSALLRWTRMTPFAAAIRDCTIPLNAMPKMSGIQVNDACDAGDIFGRLALYSGGAKESSHRCMKLVAWVSSCRMTGTQLILSGYLFSPASSLRPQLRTHYIV